MRTHICHDNSVISGTRKEEYKRKMAFCGVREAGLALLGAQAFQNKQGLSYKLERVRVHRVKGRDKTESRGNSICLGSRPGRSVYFKASWAPGRFKSDF